MACALCFHSSSQHALDVATMDALTENLPLNVTIRSSNLYQKPHNSRPVRQGKAVCRVACSCCVHGVMLVVDLPPHAQASSSNPILGLHDHLVDLKAAGSYVVVLSIRSFDIPVIFEALEDEGMFGDPWVCVVQHRPFPHAGLCANHDIFVERPIGFTCFQQVPCPNECDAKL